MIVGSNSQFKVEVPPKPKVLPVQFENIPHEITSRRRRVVWLYEVRQDKKGTWKWTKVPYQACPPPPDEECRPKAKCNDPSTWSSYDAAMQTYLEVPGWDGIGYMLGDDHAGVDCDKCVSPEGVIEPWAEEVVRQIDSYTEISPSGTGGKILVLGKLPEGRRRTGRLEMYSETRFFAITGNWLPGTPKTVEPRQSQLLQLHARIFPNEPKGNGKCSAKNDHAHAEHRTGTFAWTTSASCIKPVLRATATRSEPFMTTGIGRGRASSRSRRRTCRCAAGWRSGARAIP